MDKANYWYYSRPNEIFLDLDNSRSISRAISVIGVSLHNPENPISHVYLWPTQRKGHCHMVVMLSDYMSNVERLAWSLWMANDRLRVSFVLRRWQNWVKASKIVPFTGDVLVSHMEYHRPWDDICYCTEKHKDKTVTDNCEAMQRLLGEERSADYFPRTGPIGFPDAGPLMVRWGEVNKDQILKWSRTDGQKNVL